MSRIETATEEPTHALHVFWRCGKQTQRSGRAAGSRLSAAGALLRRVCFPQRKNNVAGTEVP